MEYSGPPVRYDIPQGVPVDVRRIPTAAVAAKVLSNLSLPVIQPIVKSKHSERKFSNGLKGSEVTESPVSVVQLGKFGSSKEILSRKLENGDENSSSSGTLEFWKIVASVLLLVESDKDWSSIAEFVQQ
ncbi:extra-large guanine nucleotide-binding protein 1-like [Forsythia ovata]|uniref:Extra-large guanine nucleotide-binding protein 1-like n=1 Tax=Forsythia ovata TaxID=205694 RepID=A0ABD1PZ65_9LAMI